MTCLTPINIKNPKKARGYTDMFLTVPCGKCVACLKRRARSWVFRLMQEDQESYTSAFVTYTYDQENVPLSPNGWLTLDRKHHSEYMKKLRSQLWRDGYRDPEDPEKPLKLKYYLVGEYGGQFERPHYHAILFNLPEFYQVNEHKLEEIWQKGRVQVDQVTGASIAYVCGYVNKQTFFYNYGEDDDRIPEFSFMSKGLGLNYLSEEVVKSLKKRLNPFLTVENGHKIPLPRYYKEKAFTDEEMTLINEKAKDHLETSQPFEDEKHRRDYIKYQADQRLKAALSKKRKEHESERRKIDN